mmetsp:Transcript_115068/g.245820  ORF Transcript_115068/g.245820 Transcript_115068/m.245820 type:complete len:217 (+) Transcript_115068:310-960(+)
MGAYSEDPRLWSESMHSRGDRFERSASIEDVVHNDHTLWAQGCVGDNLYLAHLPGFRPELVGHHEPNLQLIGHLPRSFCAACIGGANQRLLQAEAGNHLADEVGEILRAHELVKRRMCRTEARLCLIMEVHCHEAVRPRRDHEVQEELRCDGFASLKLAVLPCVLDTGQHNSDPVRCLGLQRIEHHEQLHEHKVDLALTIIARAHHEDIMVRDRLF